MAGGNMHVDSVTVNPDGSMTITLNEFMNPAVAASFVGSTSGVVVTTPNVGSYQSELKVVITLTPAAPIVESAAAVDAGGSASIDG